MEFPFYYNANNEEGTRQTARKFANILTEGSLVVFNGELGAGKTFFIKELCKSFGVNDANSPSFSIVNEYNGIHKIYHFDFYRIRKEEELYDIGFEDYLNDENAIVFIEWGELFNEMLPGRKYVVELIDAGNHKRGIKINYHDKQTNISD